MWPDSCRSKPALDAAAALRGWCASSTRTASGGVPKKFWDIAIRIEDDALVTAKGCELMTRGVPVKAGEIEALMREGGSCDDDSTRRLEVVLNLSGRRQLFFNSKNSFLPLFITSEIQ